MKGKKSNETMQMARLVLIGAQRKVESDFCAGVADHNHHSFSASSHSALTFSLTALDISTPNVHRKM